MSLLITWIDGYGKEIEMCEAQEETGLKSEEDCDGSRRSETVVYPENAYTEKYRLQLLENQLSGVCPFGHNVEEGIWEYPGFESQDYYLAENTVVKLEGEGNPYVLLLISRKHQVGVEALRPSAFLQRGQAVSWVREHLGEPAGTGERFGDYRSGKTVAHEHMQILRYPAEKPWGNFMAGTYGGEDVPFVLDPNEGRLSCWICRQQERGLEPLAQTRDHMLVNKIPRRKDLSNDPVHMNLAIVPKDHRPPQSLTESDHVQRGQLFSAAVLNQGITGGIMVEHLCGGPDYHACLEIIVPRLMIVGEQWGGKPVNVVLGQLESE